jgi:ankyrin repeat protein
MWLGWYATRTDVPKIQAEQPTRPAVAAMPTALAEALQTEAEPLREEAIATADPALHELVAAIKAGDADDVSALLADGAYFDSMDGPDHVLLPIAAKEGQLAIVQLLLDAGADVNSTMDGRAPDREFSEAPALLHAAAWGHLDVVELLLANGAKPNEAEASFGEVPLHYAAHYNHADIVNALLDNGAAVDVRRQGDGTTPFHWAIINNSIEAAEALIDGGAHVNLVEEQAGLSPLILLFSSTQVNVNDTIRLLLDAGADVNIASEWGTTPLMYAESSPAPGRAERVRWLLEAGADPDAQDMGGNTALHFAAKWGYKDVMELLIAHGAALDTENIEGKTALDMAYKDEIREMLRAAGAEDS